MTAYGLVTPLIGGLIGLIRFILLLLLRVLRKISDLGTPA